MRRKLIGSLYAQPTSLAMGALAGIVTAGAAAYETRTIVLDALGLALVSVAVLRVLVAAWLSRHLEDGTRDTGLLEVAYESGALTYALLVGAVGAVVLWNGGSTHLQVLCVSYALVYGVAIAGRPALRAAMPTP